MIPAPHFRYVYLKYKIQFIAISGGECYFFCKIIPAAVTKLRKILKNKANFQLL